MMKCASKSCATSEADRLSEWDAFVTRNQGHATLSQDAIYALPVGLIESLQDLPQGKFFSAAQESFERDLTAIAGAGFFLGEPFGYPLEVDCTAHNMIRRKISTDATSREIRDSKERVEEMIRDERRKRGVRECDIEQLHVLKQASRETLEQMSLAYAGWLVTNPIFHKTMKCYRQKWEDKILQIREFPRFPKSFFGLCHNAPVDQREFISDTIQLYRHWSLDHMATWQLPVPMSAEFADVSFYSFPESIGAGITIFVPWHVLRRRDLAMAQLMQAMQEVDGPSHLREWLDGLPKNRGPKFYTTVLRLYRYLELGLRRRYPKQVKGNLGRIEGAISVYLRGMKDDAAEAGREKIRKARQYMDKKLQSL